MRELVIVGTGGVGRALAQFARDVNEASERWRLVGWVDDEPGVAGTWINGLPVLGGLEALRDFDEVDVLVAVGGPVARRAVVERLRPLDVVSFPSLVHPRAYVPADVPIGEGVVVYPGACVDPDTELGPFALVNQNATVGHDTSLGAFATLAPGACIGGTVTVGEGANIGIGASCIQGLTLGAWCTVGAGAAVIRDVKPGSTVVGVPARPKGE